MTVPDNPRKLLALIQAHRRLALIVFVVIFAGGALYAYLLPPKYTSSMRILIRATPTDLRASPERADGTTLGQVSDAEVNSEVQLLTSYDLLEQAVIKNHLEQPSTAPDTHQRNVDSAVRGLGGALQVSVVRNTNIIEVQYSATTPQVAASVLRSVEEGYLDAHLRAQSTPGGYRFFQDQAEYYQAQLSKAQLAFAKFSSSQNAANLDQQRTLLTETIADQQAALQKSEAQIAQLRMEIAESETIAGSLSPRIPTSRRSEPNQGAVDHLISVLADLENRRVLQTSKFRDDDPLVEETNAEIAATRKALQNTTSLVSYEESTDVNPISQTIRSGEETRAVELAGLKSKVAIQKQQIASNKDTINHLMDVSGQNALLLSNVQNAQKEYDEYVQREEAARVSEGLDRNKITNVVMAQEPTVSVLPVGSHRLLVLLFSFFAAVFASVVSSILAENLQPSHELQNA